MSTTVFTSKEICDIIETCSKSEVKLFRCGDLRFSFQDRKEFGQDRYTIQSPGQATAINENIFSDDIIQKDEIKMKEDELELLRIEDPLAYEDLLIARELEPGDN